MSEAGPIPGAPTVKVVCWPPQARAFEEVVEPVAVSAMGAGSTHSRGSVPVLVQWLITVPTGSCQERVTDPWQATPTHRPVSMFWRQRPAVVDRLILTKSVPFAPYAVTAPLPPEGMQPLQPAVGGVENEREIAATSRASGPSKFAMRVNFMICTYSNAPFAWPGCWFYPLTINGVNLGTRFREGDVHLGQLRIQGCSTVFLCQMAHNPLRTPELPALSKNTKVSISRIVSRQS